MIGITGFSSSIAQELLNLIDEHPVVGSVHTLPMECDRYFLCAGVLYGIQASEMEEHEVITTLAVNFSDVIAFCDKLFDYNPRARVCVMGSESGFAGSYDVIYAGSKAALHMYVETKKLKHPGQQLVAIAPTIIEKTGMTNRRKDLDATIERGKSRRMGRWLNPQEVAKLVHYVLYVDQGALCNTVIRMTGGIN